LRKKNFDLVIDLQNNRKSHILTYLSFIPDRYGFDNKKFGFLLNHRIKNAFPPIDPVSHQFKILKMLDIELKDSRLEMWTCAYDQSYIDDLLSQQWMSSKQRLIGINLSARWSSKNWPAENMSRFCEEAAKRDMRVVITGTEADLDQANLLISLVKNTKLINACGKTTVNQLACLIRRCSVYISADSAPLHIAASVGIPLVGLFGPTDPRRHMPPAKKSVLIKKDLPCGPCYKSNCKTRKCMGSITSEEVIAAVDSLLQ